MKEYKTLAEIVEQLEFAKYECEGGVLTKNVAFIKLKEMAKYEPKKEGTIKQIDEILEFVKNELLRIQHKWDKAVEEGTQEDVQFNEVFYMRYDKLFDAQLLLNKLK